MPSEPRGCLANLLGGFLGPKGSGATNSDLPDVMISQRFLSAAEINFYRVLQSVVGDRGIIFAQVSCNQLLHLPGNNQTNPGRTTWQNKIARRAIDFVICDPKTLQPKVAIELDDASHARTKREQRDEEIERLFATAKLSLLRVLVSKQYSTRELSDTIGPHLK
jgi:hypothetical protein